MSVTQRRRLYCNRKNRWVIFGRLWWSFHFDGGKCTSHRRNSTTIHTKGHIYPEILIGTLNDLETVNYLIKNVLFEKESYKSNCTIILMNASLATLIIQLSTLEVHSCQKSWVPSRCIKCNHFSQNLRNEVSLHADK
jgi:hypothetical protein